jgi:hypothetical protein
LPCEYTQCREHLSERVILKQNRIKCKKCNQEFGVNYNDYKSNEDLKKLVASQSYLNGKEGSLKQQLEETIRKIFQFYDEFIFYKTQLESNVFDNFHEIRFKIDEHHERLKKK